MKNKLSANQAATIGIALGFVTLLGIFSGMGVDNDTIMGIAMCFAAIIIATLPIMARRTRKYPRK